MLSKSFKLFSSLLILYSSFAYASEQSEIDELRMMSLEELMEIEIVSVSKKESLLKESASAVFVLTDEDIRRSGLTSFAELMRLVPGMQVSQKNASVWGVTSRGFNNLRANKLLVMVDGRSLYSPLYSGVFWDQLDYILEDIQRVEVIRGPGGAIWGANAVNGVVNIITKSAKDTSGVYGSIRVGKNENHIAEARYGGSIGEDTNFRVYAKTSDYDNYVFANDGNQNRTGDVAGKVKGDDAFDKWYLNTAGFKIDSWISSNDFLSLSADLYSGEVHDAHNTDEEDIRGESINLSYNHSFNDGSDLHIQTYFNHFYRLDGEKDDPKAILRDLYMYDIDAVYTKRISNHALNFGLGYRYSADDTNPNSIIDVNPQKRYDNYYSAFVQDEISFDNKLTLTLGAKFEHNNYTGFEVQPNVRLLGYVNEDNILWAAVSRSIRTPSRMQSDEINRQGNDLDAEKAISYELGYRYIQNNFSIDSTLFFVDYDELIAIQDGVTNDPHGNIVEGYTYGFESSVTYKINKDLKVMGSYSFLYNNFEEKADAIERYNEVSKIEGTSPSNQFNIRSYYNITSKLQYDMMFYYVSELDHGIGTGTTAEVDAYSRLDLRLAWVEKDYEIIAGAQNLFEKEHIEFSSSSRTSTAVPKNYYVQLKVRF